MRKELETIIVIITMISLASAVANLQVVAFSCTPSETTVDEAFSCTAQIQNNGDASGTVGTATLYPDSDWMENANYPKSVSTTITVGQSSEVTFSGLKATTTGNNGFQRILLDDVTDTYVSDEDVTMNIIDINIGLTSSATSKAMGQTFDATAEVTAGGDVDVSLAFSVSSGGCSIGSQTNPKTITGMTDGSRQTRTWTVTQGTTAGDCVYAVSASATGTGGVSTTTDSDSDTVTCSDCPVASSSTSSGSGGGGGGGGSAKYSLGTLTEEKSLELSKEDKAVFNFDGENHTIKITAVEDTTITMTIQSEEQKATLSVGERKSFDITNDGKNDIEIKLTTINVLTKQAKITLTPLRQSKTTSEGNTEGEKTPPSAGEENNNQAIKAVENIIKSKPFIWSSIITGIVIILIIILTLLGVIKWKKIKEEDKNKKVKVYKESIFSKAKSIIKAK